MANTIRIKRRTSGSAGAPSGLKNAELAFNEVDEILYYGKGDSSGDATSILAIAGPGAFVNLTGTQTVSGNKTFSGTVTVGAPTSDMHAATKKYVDDSITSSSSSFTLAGDSGTSQTISSGNTLTVSGGTGLSSVAGATDTVTINLDNTAVSAGTYGSASQVGVFTVDAQGRLTSASNASIAIYSTDVSDFAEAVADTVGAMVNSNTESGISVTYQDGDNTLDFDVADFDITLSGDVTGTGTVTNLGNVTISATIAANSVALGTDTTGNYVSDLTAGTGVTITHTPGEGSSPTVAIGQAVASSDSPTFAGLNLNGTIVFEGATADAYETTLTVTDPTADRTITLPNATDTLVGKATTDTFTNKTFDTAGSGNSFSVNGNAITSYVGSGNNVVLSSSPTITNLFANGLTVTGASIVLEGATDDAYETTLTVTDPTADRTITFPDATGTVALGQTVTTSSDVTFASVTTTANGSIGGNLTVTGNLTVNGTTTTINSTTVSVDDKNIELAATASPSDASADGAGLTVKGDTDKTWNWVDATDAWTSSEHVNIATGKAYYINGTSVLNGTTLGSGVTSSSLTSVGTIGTGTWQGTAVAVAYGGTGATSASSARTNLGLAIGTDVQAYNSTLAAVAGGTYTGASSITTLGTIATGAWQGTAVGLAYGGTGATTASGARTALELGTIATQNANNVSISGGSIDGITFDGGTF